MGAEALTKLPPWLSRGLKHPVARAAAMTLGIRVGQEAYRLRRGEMSREDFVKRSGQHVGALSGTLSGAALGFYLGRAWPGVGAIVGAFGGGLLGHMGGEHVGRVAALRISEILTADEDSSSRGGLSEDAEGPHETHEEPPVAPPEDGGGVGLPRRTL